MKGRDRGSQGESSNIEKHGKTRNFNWTPKRKVALECLIQARGNVRLAVELSKQHSSSVSIPYVEELKYSAEYLPFREEYNRRTGELLQALEVDTEFVIKGLVELTRPDIPASTRRQALRDLGQYLGIWDRKRKEIEDYDATRERIRRAIEKETDPEKKKAIGEAFETLADILQ